MEQVTVKNNQLRLAVLSYGAIIQRLEFRDPEGQFRDMAVGLKDPEGYLQDEAYLGACVGRFAGRISGGCLQIDGSSHPISHRDGITLHGGERGLGRRYWTFGSSKSGDETAEVRLHYLSPHGEEGFPGNLRTEVTYRLEGSTLLIRHRAETDRPTVVNLANHSYFKIDTEDRIGHYRLQVGARHHIETDDRLLPTGRVLEVSGTPLDFRQPRTLDGTLLDTPYVLDPNYDFAAELSSPVSGVALRVVTNQPAMVVYTPPHFPGICFETQGYPDAPGHPDFPSTLLMPGETYLNESRFHFRNIR